MTHFDTVADRIEADTLCRAGDLMRGRPADPRLVARVLEQGHARITRVRAVGQAFAAEQQQVTR